VLGDFAATPRFQVVRCIGAGGAGTVYEALDVERNARVALKTLHALDAEALLRFKREFRDFQNLRHPNLVSVWELFSDGAEWFFSMELVEGTSFLEYVRPDDELDEARLRATLTQLAEGLVALHAANKVHCDIKPSNILVTEAGRAVLLDFGLAADVERGEDPDGPVVGTIAYMAPEQAAGISVAPAADWYALGVVLFEALTGQLPFPGSAMEILMAKQREAAPAPRSPAPDLDALCADLLQLDPALRPTGPAVLARLGQRQLARPSAPSLTGSAPFVGRTRELQELREGFERARNGAQLVALVGESGVGKTALVRRFISSIGARDATVMVLRGACYEREAVPFKAVDGVIDSLSQQLQKLPKAESAAVLPRRTALLAQVFPVLRRIEAVAEAPLLTDEPLDPREQRSRMFGALRELFQRLADRRPVVVVIDDLQWADADSIALLSEVLRAPDAPALHLVATVRSSAALPALPGLQTIQIERLSPAEGRELAHALLDRTGAPAGIKAHQIAQEAAGHPLFIHELVRHACASSAPLPVRLEDALWERIRELDMTAANVLSLVCLADGKLLQETAAHASNLPFGEFAQQIAHLRLAHLVRTSGMRATDTVAPYHSRVRAAVLANVTSAPSLHRRIAVALERSRHPDTEALMTHWRAAGDLAKAAHFAMAAADEAETALAFDRAVTLYKIALELGNSHALRVKLAHALVHAGRSAEAGAMFERAAKNAPPAEAMILEQHAAEQLLRSGHIDEALALFGEVQAAIGMPLAETPARALGGLLVSRAKLRLRGLRFREQDATGVSPQELRRIDTGFAIALALSTVDTIRGADIQTRQLLAALKAGEPYRVARGIALEAAFNAAGGGVDAHARTERLVQTARSLAQRIDNPHALGLAAWAEGSSAYLEGRFEAAHSLSEQAVTIYRDRCRGVAWEVASAQIFSLWSASYLGRYREIAARMPALLAAADAREDRYDSTNLRASHTNTAWLAADQPDEAHAQLEQAMRQWAPRGFHLPHYYELHARTQHDLYTGDVRTAWQRISDGWSKLDRAFLFRLQIIRIEATFLRARAATALAIADRSQADALLASATRDARRLDSESAPWASALALLVRAGVAAERGEATAGDLYGQAATALDEVDMALHAAASRRQRGLHIQHGEVAAAERFIADQAIRAPSRMAALLAPHRG
jgi:tetratricopeptide (TPR) repeat protein